MWLVIYLNCTMMHGLTNPKLKMYDFSGETFKGFEVLYFSMSANDDTTALEWRVLQTVL
jgi:hypothetical protein